MKKKYYIFGILYLVAIIFIMNDTWLYTTPIAKLTKVETTREVEGKSTRGTAEKKYSQKMQGNAVGNFDFRTCGSGRTKRDINDNNSWNQYYDICGVFPESR